MGEEMQRPSEDDFAKALDEWANDKLRLWKEDAEEYEVAALRAGAKALREAERLRAALREIADEPSGSFGYEGEMVKSLEKMERIARDALAAGKEGREDDLDRGESWRMND